MKDISIITIFMISVLFLSSCEKRNEKPVNDPKTLTLTTKAEEVIKSSNQFGIDFFTHVAKDENSNMMVSPLSASIALTMLLNGADNETYNQIKEMLDYDENMTIEEINEAYMSLVPQLINADEKVTTTIANAVFYRMNFSFRQSFLDQLINNFDAHAESLDFNNPQAVNTINEWAGDQTNGKIDKVIEAIDPLTVMFIMNALYFKGDWTNQFDASSTTSLPFYFDNNTQEDVETMTGEIPAKTFGTNEFSALELPYGRKNFSMVLIKPQHTLNEFYNNFDDQIWQEITESFQNQENWVPVQVQLPKFSFEYEKTLNKILEEMGMVDAFSEALADLSGISEEELYVSFVKQNTFIDVNEEGTEAAAVTTIGINTESVGPVFFANKPFIFAIRERTTNTLLFMGSVENPND
ncbi:MAG: serpin family protein [Bacteroidales bacterium]